MASPDHSPPGAILQRILRVLPRDRLRRGFADGGAGRDTVRAGVCVTQRPLIAITLGDPAGIGPEVAVKALQRGRAALAGAAVPAGLADERGGDAEVNRLDARAAAGAAPGERARRAGDDGGSGGRRVPRGLLRDRGALGRGGGGLAHLGGGSGAAGAGGGGGRDRDGAYQQGVVAAGGELGHGPPGGVPAALGIGPRRHHAGERRPALHAPLHAQDAGGGLRLRDPRERAGGDQADGPALPRVGLRGAAHRRGRRSTRTRATGA